MKIYLISLLLLPLFGIAEETENRLQHFLPEDCYFSGAFKEVKQLPDVADLSSHGHFYFDCQLGLIWQTKAPLQHTLYYAIKGQHYEQKPGAAPKVLKGRAHKNLGRLLTSLLAGDSEWLLRYFKVDGQPQDASTKLDYSSLRLVTSQASWAKFITSLEISKLDTELGDQVHISMVGERQGTTKLLLDNFQVYLQAEQADCESLIESPQLCQLLASEHHAP